MVKTFRSGHGAPIGGMKGFFRLMGEFDSWATQIQYGGVNQQSTNEILVQLLAVM